MARRGCTASFGVLRLEVVGDQHGDGLAGLPDCLSAGWAVRDAAVPFDIEVIECNPPLSLVRRARAAASLPLSLLVVPDDFEVGSAWVEPELSPLIERLRAARCWHWFL
jgi:hypothetical protein